MPEVLRIPIVLGGGPFRQSLLLENEEYIFDFSFNQRDPAWYLSIFKGAEIIVLRLRLVAGINLLEPVISLEKPPGFLYLYDVNLKTVLGNDPDINTLGDRILLIYEEAV